MNKIRVAQALELLGLEKTAANRFALQKWETKGVVEAKRDKEGVRIFNPESLEKLKKKLDKLPRSYYSAGEVAKNLDVSKTHVQRLRQAGKLHAVQHPASGYWLYDKWKFYGDVEKLNLKPKKL